MTRDLKIEHEIIRTSPSELWMSVSIGISSICKADSPHDITFFPTGGEFRVRQLGQLPWAPLFRGSPLWRIGHSF